ncbi:hypothetical protein TWF506_010635 [Arthrobotrys conoides]|uniref:BTB domain-containing protein n=1 Tax=Arthrobotrys conoides TaxID=74498 RepID=A0AAN8RVX8_9PEZI
MSASIPNQPQGQMETAETRPSSPSSAFETPGTSVSGSGGKLTDLMNKGPSKDNNTFYDLAITIPQPWTELIEHTVANKDKLEKLFYLIHTEPKFSMAMEVSTGALLGTKSESGGSTSALLNDNTEMETSDDEDDDWLPNDDPDRGQTVFARLLGNPRFSDVELYVGSEKKLIKGHLAVLAEKSEFFNSKVPDHCPTRPLKVDMTTFDPDSFKYILEYIYSGVISHPEHPTVIAELYHQSLYLGVREFTDHILDYIYEVLEVEVEDTKSISMDYTIALIRGLQFRKIGTPETCKKLKAIFEIIVEFVDFDHMLQQNAFTLMLDEHPEVARVMLCKYSKVKLLKVRQEYETCDMDDFDGAEHEKLLAKGHYPDAVKALRQRISDQYKTLEKLKTKIKKLDSHHEQLVKENTLLDHTLDAFSVIQSD